MSEASIANESHRLRRNPKIAISLRYYQRIGIEQTAKTTVAAHLAELARGREIAYDLGQASAGIQAEHYRGRVSGLYEDKLRLTVGPTDEALLSQVAALLGEDIAHSIGEGLGVDITATETIDIEETRESKLLAAPSGLEE